MALSTHSFYLLPYTVDNNILIDPSRLLPLTINYTYILLYLMQ